MPLSLMAAIWVKPLSACARVKKPLRLASSRKSSSEITLVMVWIWENWLSRLVWKWLLICPAISRRYTSLIFVTV